jgi:outer membrane protein assembly factor BamE (lipoprotein component of BamABCDE complex)
MSVPLPKSKFTPHPQGQHTGNIFDVEVRLNDETQWGKKHRLILKVESDTKMVDEQGQPILDNEGNHRGYVIWDWLTVARKEGSRFRDRREAILGRPLTSEEVNADSFDPVEEFKGKRIGYVVKHRMKNENLYANIDTIWLAEEEGKDKSASPKPSEDAKETSPPKPQVEEDDDDLPF